MIKLQEKILTKRKIIHIRRNFKKYIKCTNFHNLKKKNKNIYKKACSRIIKKKFLKNHDNDLIFKKRKKYKKKLFVV